ncbi:MAG: pantoate--beta-alanine ligase [Cyclobacteriaceae bacterium]
MRAISSPQDMYLICSELIRNDQKIGLVPTMGALHQGHLELVKRSLNENNKTVVSVFVNPLQFNKTEDLKNYPRTFEQDRDKLKRLGVDFLFHPTEEEFYGTTPTTYISFGNMEKVLEGAYRPGHFGGVGVVVAKFFHLIQPTRAYFGLKDLQQYLLIKKMAQDLSFNIEIVGVKTVREESGLAMSSRNQRLSTEGLKTAAKIFKGLSMIEPSLRNDSNLEGIRNDILKFYASVSGLELEYLEFVDGISLNRVNSTEGISELAVCFAGYVESVRLIDNLYLRLK